MLFKETTEISLRAETYDYVYCPLFSQCLDRRLTLVCSVFYVCVSAASCGSQRSANHACCYSIPSSRWKPQC